MPLHRKSTHRSRIFATVLGVAVTVSGVAYAAQIAQEPVRSAPEPLTAVTPSSSATSDRLSAPESPGQREARPSRSTPTVRVRLGQKPGRSSQREGAASRKDPRPSPTLASRTARSHTPSTPTPTRASGSPSSPSGILGGTNAARSDAGLPALGVDPCLARLAERHAQRLAAAGRLFHQDLGAVMASCGMSTAGENVAMNHTGPSDMVGQWLASPAHRANLLSRRFTLIGIGVAQGRDGAWYAVQVFGDT